MSMNNFSPPEPSHYEPDPPDYEALLNLGRQGLDYIALEQDDIGYKKMEQMLKEKEDMLGITYDPTNAKPRPWSTFERIVNIGNKAKELGIDLDKPQSPPIEEEKSSLKEKIKSIRNNLSSKIEGLKNKIK